MAPKKNENQEWAEALQTGSDNNKKLVLQSIIVAMTAGRDVSWIFADVIKCIFTKDLELKKLIYLYLVNYARQQPESSILAVNCFLKDAENHDSSIVRALAIRTMSSIPLPQVAEYLVEPLSKTLKDPDPYVRKTSALAAAKLHELSPESAEANGLVHILGELTCDSNQAVVANACSALLDIAKRSATKPEFNEAAFNSILAAVAECNEWGLVQLLEALAYMQPADQYEALAALEKVSAKLQHANPAVVINAIKVILQLIRYVDEDTRVTYAKRVTPPFVTLLSTESHEIQYLTLRCASSVIAAYPQYMKFDLRVFLPKYHDPLFVKYEKLDLILQICNDDNVNLILSELKDYCLQEVDSVFVKKCVKTIGKVGIKLVNQAGLAVQTLVELVKKVSNDDTEDGETEGQQVFIDTANRSETSYTVVAQEALVAIRDTIRCYPGYFEGAIVHVLQAIKTVDDPEARSALFYIIGEHAGVIENAFELLKQFTVQFTDETEGVQLSLLTAAVKVFLTSPTEDTQALCQEVLTQATSLGTTKTKNCSPDVRERGYFYWRLLSLDDMEAAKQVVFGATVGYDREKATRIVEAYAAFNSFVPNLGSYSCVQRQAVRNVERTTDAKRDDLDVEDVLVRDEAEVPQGRFDAPAERAEAQPAAVKQAPPDQHKEAAKTVKKSLNFANVVIGQQPPQQYEAVPAPAQQPAAAQPPPKKSDGGLGDLLDF